MPQINNGVIFFNSVKSSWTHITPKLWINWKLKIDLGPPPYPLNIFYYLGYGGPGTFYGIEKSFSVSMNRCREVGVLLPNFGKFVCVSTRKTELKNSSFFIFYWLQMVRITPKWARSFILWIRRNLLKRFFDFAFFAFFFRIEGHFFRNFRKFGQNWAFRTP